MKDPIDCAQHCLGQAAHYLKMLSFDDVRTESTRQPVAEALQERWTDWADFFLGSLTKALIHDERKPLLIAP
jgi:hypothetical protein